MPIEVKYPGGYVEERPSSTNTITGVSNSTTAFIGRALKGSVDETIMISSFREF